MTSRERVQAALNHKEPDRIPLDFGSGHACKFTKYFYLKLLDYFGFEDEKKDLVVCQKPYQLVYASDKVLDALKCDVRNARVKYLPNAVPSPYEKEWSDEIYDYYTNDLGTTYRMPKTGGLYFDNCGTALADAEEEEDDEKFVWPTPKKVDPACRKEMEDYRAKGFYNTTCQVYANGFLQTGPLLYGYEKFFMMLMLEEERCIRMMDILYEKKIEWYNNMFEVYGGLFDCTAEADDFGVQAGLLCNKHILCDITLPYHKRLNAYLKEKQPGLKTTLHTCGSVYDIMDDIIDAGYDCLNPVQIAAYKMEPERLKKEFGDRITFWGGGINTQSTLPRGTVQQVRDETKRIIDAFAPGGGFVFSTVHNVQDDVPIENFMAMWETFQDNCKY